MEASAPASLTALFAPVDDGTGSLGASVALADGVVADVRPADGTRVSVDGTPTDFEPVERALDALGVTASVALDPGIPIGCGLGASGAATLATVLAADAEFGLGNSREALVGVAHEAEVAAGTGLGDVFVQDRGGLLVDDGSGRRRWEPEAAVEYESYGGIDTGEALGDEALMERVGTEGRRLLGGIPAEPTLADVTGCGWAFARAIGLADDEVTGTVAAVEDAGGTASMAMVGRTVFAVGVDGLLDRRTRVSNDGAGLV